MLRGSVAAVPLVLVRGRGVVVRGGKDLRREGRGMDGPPHRSAGGQ